MTASETTNARLAVVETQIEALKADVAEIKKDVKSLIASQAEAVARERANANTGVWVRSVVPWVLMAMGLLLTVMNTLDLTLIAK
jgi:hypothetical protein